MDQFLSSKRNYYSYLSLLLLLTLLPVLLYINSASIRIWDEGRQAVNATTMLLNQQYLVTYFGAEPDLWNTKPPLLIWLQVLGLKVFGIGEAGLRVPSALAGLLTVTLLFWFGWQKLNKPLIGIFGAMILLASRGYLGQHVMLTGDFDALLTLFITAYSLFFFLYLENFEKKYWVLVTLALILGALTKSVAALLPLPGLVVYALVSGKFLMLLKRKEVYLGVICFFLVLGAYYYFREQVNPGYWQAVQENELGGRFLKTLEEHDRPWYYYLTGDKFMPWLLLILPAIYVCFRFSEGLTRRFALFATLFFFGFLITISASQTKLLWYAAPLYPIGALLVATGFYYGYQFVILRYKMQQPRRFILFSWLLIFGIFYGIIIGKILSQPRRDRTDLLAADGHFVKDFHRELQGAQQYTFLSEEEYNSSLDFYFLKYRHEGDSIKDKRDLGHKNDLSQTRNLLPGEIVLTCSPTLRESLLAQYRVEKVLVQDRCLAVKIIGKK